MQPGPREEESVPSEGARRLNEFDQTQEEPLLLNPYFDSPLDHLHYVFNYRKGEPTGFIKGTTEKGRVSVRIYDLNRTEMVDDRKQAQRSSISEYESALFKGRHKAFIDEIKRSKPAYTAARLGAILSWIKWYKTTKLDAGAQQIEEL